MVREDLNKDNEMEQGGGSGEEEAAEFLRSYSQISKQELEEHSLRNQWKGSRHLLECKRPTQVAVLAVFALKAIVVDEDMKGLAGEVADAAPVTKEARPSGCFLQSDPPKS